VHLGRAADLLATQFPKVSLREIRFMFTSSEMLPGPALKLTRKQPDQWHLQS
jgi:hypothetical protein